MLSETSHSFESDWLGRIHCVGKSETLLVIFKHCDYRVKNEGKWCCHFLFWVFVDDGFFTVFYEISTRQGDDPTGSCFYVDPAQSAIVHLAGAAP